MATAGRSLDYAPSLFHHHPTALAHSLARPSPSPRPSPPSPSLGVPPPPPPPSARITLPSPIRSSLSLWFRSSSSSPHAPSPFSMSPSPFELPTIRQLSPSVPLTSTPCHPPAYLSTCLPADLSRSHQRHDTALSSSDRASFSFQESPSLSLQQFSSHRAASSFSLPTARCLRSPSNMKNRPPRRYADHRLSLSLSPFLSDEFALTRTPERVPLSRAYVLTPIRSTPGPSFLKAIPWGNLPVRG